MTFNLLYPAAFDTPQNISKHCIVHISFIVLSHSFYQRHPIESFIYRIPELIFSTCNCFMCLFFTSKHDFRLIIIWMIIPGTCSIYQLNSWYSNFNLSNIDTAKKFQYICITFSDKRFAIAFSRKLSLHIYQWQKSSWITFQFS